MLLATWNVLADAYVRRERSPGVDPALLRPAARRAAILTRASGLDADLLCLQEVEEPCFAALRAHLAPLGYTGTWCPKTGGRPDGCATFWRGRTATAERVFVQPDGSHHVAQATDFPDLVVVTTHLKWNPPAAPPAEQWSLRQAEALVAWLRADPRPVLVCGDFNVEPGHAALAAFASGGLHDVFAGALRPHTCCANGHTAKVDHVLARGLTVRPAPRQFDQAGTSALPSSAEPSDHVPLLVEWF